MTGERSKSRADGTAALSGQEADEVRAYLKANPDFLNENPELLEALTPPALRTGDNVRDMQQYLLVKLREEVASQRACQAELLDTSRINMSVQAQVHKAALALLDAHGFEHLIHIVTSELADLLAVDVVTICVEATDEAPAARAQTAGVFLLEQHGVDSRIGQGRDVMLANDIPADPEVFGPAAGLVKSQALARLRAGPRAPEGLLALGSRDPDKFHSGQGAELLVFLSHMLERLIRGWLNLPS